MQKTVAKDTSVAGRFGNGLASLLAQKIQKTYPSFPVTKYKKYIAAHIADATYSKRLQIHAEALHAYLPKNYSIAVSILVRTLGEENPYETGMFKNYYWTLPISKFIELYGLEDVNASLSAIAELTKRSTGEYAIRPFLKMYPKKTMQMMSTWSRSKNFHLRRLASEGCRPKLPWATKLDTFIEHPKPVFSMLARLMKDDSAFVRRSVANNIADYLKVNTPVAIAFMRPYQSSIHPHTKWILKHATRRVKV